MSTQRAATDSFCCVDGHHGALAPVRSGGPATARKADRLPPQLGVHTDLREARYGIDLVDIDLASLFLQEEIHAREAAEIQGSKSRYSPTPYLFRRCLWNSGGDNELGQPPTESFPSVFENVFRQALRHHTGGTPPVSAAPPLH